jgi:hypothetical protein
MIEFALSAMTLIYAFTGVFQFGYSMYLYNELQGAVRAGARYASFAMISIAPNSGTQDTGWQGKVQNVMVYGTPSPGQNPTPVVPGLTIGQVNAVAYFDPAQNKIPTYVTVNISGYTIDAVVKTFNLSNKPLLTMPFMGQYCVISSSGC